MFSLVPFQHFNLFLHIDGTFFMYITTNHINESLEQLLNDLLLASAISISKVRCPKKPKQNRPFRTSKKEVLTEMESFFLAFFFFCSPFKSFLHKFRYSKYTTTLHSSVVCVVILMWMSLFFALHLQKYVHVNTSARR